MKVTLRVHGITSECRGALSVLLAGALILLSMGACGGDDEAIPSAATTASPTVPYRLGADGAVLIGPGGQRISVQSGAIAGYVDNVIPADDVVNVSGWAATGDLGRPAERVVGVVGEAGVGQAEPKFARPDVVDAYGKPAIEKSGFALFVLTSSLDCAAPAAGLTVFGIAGDVATPLAMVAGSDESLDDVC